MLGQQEKAIKEYDEAIRLDPERAEAYANRGLVYTFLGNGDLAQRDFDRALNLGFDRGTLEHTIERLMK